MYTHLLPVAHPPEVYPRTCRFCHLPENVLSTTFLWSLLEYVTYLCWPSSTQYLHSCTCGYGALVEASTHGVVIMYNWIRKFWVSHPRNVSAHSSAGVPGILYQEMYIPCSGYTQKCHLVAIWLRQWPIKLEASKGINVPLVASHELWCETCTMFIWTSAERKLAQTNM